MNFPTRLKELRNEFKLTQEHLGKKINVTKVSISGYESGNRSPDLETLQKLSVFFGVNVDYLLGKSRYRTWQQVFEEGKKMPATQEHASTGGRAYTGGGSDWSEEQKKNADRTVNELNDRIYIQYPDGFKVFITEEEDNHLKEQLKMFKALKKQEKK